MKTIINISVFFIAVLAGSIISGLIIDRVNADGESATVVHDTIVVEKSIQLNNALVYKMILDAQIREPETVLKQSILETGNFQSRACLQDNNLFGFTSRDGLMKFNSANDCILWYKQWQSTWYNPLKYKDYYEFLDGIGYAEDTTYTAQLKRISI